MQLRILRERLIYLAMLGCTLVACEPEPKLTLGPGVVARVDSTFVTASVLRMFVAGIPSNLRHQGQANEVRERYLRSLMAKHLLVIEARERGLDTAQVVQANVMPRWRHHLISSYRQVALDPMIKISEAEIDAYIKHSGLDLRRQMAGILVHEESTAKQLQARLEAGEEFVHLAEEYTIDERSASQGGVLGMIDLEQARKLKIPDVVFRDLPTRQVSDILPMGQYYQIIRFLQDEPVTLEEQDRQGIKKFLYERKRVELEGVEINKLVNRLEVRIMPQAVQLLLDKAALHTRVRRPHLAAEQDSVSLITYKGGRITLGDYLEMLWTDSRALSGWGVRDSAEVVNTARELLLVPTMLAQMAQRAGFDTRNEDQQWLEKVRQEFMIKQLRQEEIIDKAEASRSEAKDFYDDNEHLFKEPVEHTIIEVLVETQAQATEVLKAVKQGTILADLAKQYTTRPKMKSAVGLMELGEHERLAHPLLYKAVAMSPINKVVGPVQVKEGYSVFQVLRREGGKILPFFQVVKKASAFVRGQKREVLFEVLVDDLLDKYEERIAVSSGALAAALPDSFLQHRVE